MLDVALDGRGIKRVIAAHDGPATAVARTRRAVVSGGRDGFLRIWDPDSGALLAERRLRDPIALLAAAGQVAGPGANVASADARGRLAVWGLADPGRPTTISMVGRVRGGGPPVLVGFMARGTQMLAVGADGLVQRWEVATGRPLPAIDLRDARIEQGWPGGSSPLRVAVAHLAEEQYDGTVNLVIGTSAGDVVRVDLAALRGQVLIPAHEAVGPIVGLAQGESYGLPEIIAATPRGIAMWDGDWSEVRRGRGPAVADVAVAGASLLAAVPGGVAVSPLSDDSWSVAFDAPRGREATDLSSGPWGTVATHVDGSISVLEPRDLGLTLEPGTDSAAVASFGRDGNLLMTVGDASYTVELVLMEPGVPGMSVDGSPTPHRLVSTYTPDEDWWSQEDATEGWYVNAAVATEHHVLAAGRDPTGTAVVLAWDVATGEPLARLPLSTGGVVPDELSLATDVAELPRARLVAAYSSVQEAIVLWSTEDWSRVATVAVGPAGGFDFSPDESTIVVAGLSDSQSGASAGLERSQLVFVDVEEHRVSHTVETSGTHRVAFAPDGSRLATLEAGGRLRIRSSDGHEQLGEPVALETDFPLELAWRPDGQLIAVTLDEGGTALVDPGTGQVVEELPRPPDGQPLVLDWDPAGRLLAATNIAFDDAGDFDRVLAPSLWTLSDTALEERLCAMAGRPPDARDWRRWAGVERPLDEPCPEPQRSLAVRPRGAGSAVVAFRRGEHLRAADVEGRNWEIGLVDRTHWPPTSFTWSPSGALGWVADDQVFRLDRDSPAPRSWVCPCTRAAFDGETLVALDRAGKAVLRFSPSARRPHQIAAAGLPRYDPTLIAAVDGAVLAGGYRTPPDRSTPTTLYRIGREGDVDEIGDAGAIVVKAGTVAPDGESVAFEAAFSGGLCLNASSIGIVDVGSGRITRRPSPPDGHRPELVRSMSWSPEGVLHVAIAATGCDEDWNQPELASSARLFALRGDALIPAGRSAYDVQLGRDVTALLTGPVPWATPSATLVLERPSGERARVADRVDLVAVRP